MPTKKIDPDQQSLPYSAAIDERLAQIRSLERVLPLGPARKEGVIELLQRIALLSRDGSSSEARVSALAATIRTRRTVSERTIRRWTRDAEALGLLSVERRSKSYGGWSPNFWLIDTAKLIDLITKSGADVGRTWGGHLVSPPGRTHMSPPGVTHMSAPKEEIQERDKYSGPVPDGRSGTADGFETDPMQAADGERWCGPASRASEFVRDVPLLAEAAARRLAARPPTNWTGYGRAIFAALELSDLKPLRVIDWHLEQLSAAVPVCGPSEADLLLSLAAGAYALALPTADVKRNRMALFVMVVSRREWRKVLVHLPDCRDLLDRLGQQRGCYWLEGAEVTA